MSDEVLLVSTHDLGEVLRLRGSPRTVRRYARRLGLPLVGRMWLLTPEALARAAVASIRRGGVRPTAMSPGPSTVAGRKKLTDSTQGIDFKGKDGRGGNSQPVDNIRGSESGEPEEPATPLRILRLNDE